MSSRPDSLPAGRLQVIADLRLEGPGGVTLIRSDGGDVIIEASAFDVSGPERRLVVDRLAELVRATGQKVRVRSGGRDAITFAPGRSLLGRLLRVTDCAVRLGSLTALRELLRR